MKKLTDELRIEVYKTCGGHIMSELERTIREFNMNSDGANQAANRYAKGGLSELPEDQALVLQLQNYAWRNTATSYYDNLETLFRFIEAKSAPLAKKLREHVGSSTIAAIPDRGTAGKPVVTE